MSEETEHIESGEDAVDISFVIIGYNAASSLRECLESAKQADVGGHSYEIIYADGGSKDGSVEIAREMDLDRVLADDSRRSAAQNRNVGLNHSTGKYVQFIDSDMVLDASWPLAAVEFLQTHADYSVVCGNLEETGEGPLFEALQIDWGPREGPIRHCGGAAMYEREKLLEAGGFPEDVKYGEEPLLCWRLRNNHNAKIYQINRRMAKHGLDFKGFGDYWKRSVRCGSTYAEIAARCWLTDDPLWFRESVSNAGWALLEIAAFVALFPASWLGRLVLIGLALAVLGRKYRQMREKDCSQATAALYAAHTYFSKLPVAWGEFKWLFERGARVWRQTDDE